MKTTTLDTTATYTTMHGEEIPVRVIGTTDPWDRDRLKVEVVADRTFRRSVQIPIRYTQGEVFWVTAESLTLPEGTYPRRDGTTGTTIWACCVSSIGPTCGHRS